jgi:UDP-N-acetylmuramyl pentapeptide phosphotransferase/UDP-N-acetylglucosamine-1-phosphate transferase
MCAIPVFAGGLIEDVTHRVGPTARLLLAIVSATAGYFLLGIGVHHTDVWPVDKLLELPVAGYLITMLVVAGFTNGVNIIDGFHGLAAGTAVIMITVIMIMAYQSNDDFMVQLCGLSIACIAGFLILNWPRGKIFLGDAGAYFIGFWVVELGLLLVMRNPGISPMAPVVVGIFPLIETLFSMYRRKFLRLHPMHHPDALHLHTLVYRRLVFSPKIHQVPEDRNTANARVAWYFWLPAGVFSALALGVHLARGRNSRSCECEHRPAYDTILQQVLHEAIRVHLHTQALPCSAQVPCSATISKHLSAALPLLIGRHPGHHELCDCNWERIVSNNIMIALGTEAWCINIS